MMPSIRLRLLKLLIVPLLAMNLVGAGLTYWLAWAPARVAFDQSLADSAWALIPRLRLVGGKVEVDLPNPAEQVLRVDHFDAIYFVVRDADGRTISGDADFPALQSPAHFDDPFAYDGTMRGEPVRIISLKTRIRERQVLIGAAETLRKRLQSRSQIVIELALLEGIVTLVLIAIIWAAVGKGLSPLRRMQSELNARATDDLAPVSEKDLPWELAPVVLAINGLLNRVQAGARAQQNFLADVAHQLRTPLAGLRAQLEWMQQKYEHDPETARSTYLMVASIERMTRQTNQLLALARAEPSRYEKKRQEPVQLDKLVEESVQHFVQEADKKAIDLGFDLQPTQVWGDRFLLRDLIDNLVDNAVRYSPRDSKVTVSCVQNMLYGTISVEDEGPGIPQHAQEMIFSRFYRIDDKSDGSGLGLAIVRDIAEDHGAAITVRPGDKARGTCFSVRFQRFAASAN